MRRSLSLGVLFTGQIDESFHQSIKQLRDALGKLDDTTKKANQTIVKSDKMFAGMGGGIRGYIKDVEKLLQVQARWYAAKATLFAAVELPAAAVKSVVTYAGAIDQARAEMLRWEATSGEVSKGVEHFTDNIILNIRKATTEYPLRFEELSKSVQAFIGAGVPYDIVNQIIPDIAKLKSAFKEINFDQFAVAITGAFNTMRTTIRGANGEMLSDAEKFRAILDQILRAQAVGVIRPEQFTKVIQYMGQIGKLSGFSLQQILAMSTAITDTGISANNASRLAAGFMLSLQTDKARRGLVALGIPLKADATLAQNLDNIMKELHKRLGKGGAVSMDAMKYLQGLTSSDRLKAFVTFIDKYGKYVELTEQIKGAVGGLTKAADIMKMPLPAQWMIFQNILREIGVTANSQLTPALGGLLAKVIDIGRGFLYALDNTGRFDDKLSSLGTTGKSVYDTIKLLLERLDTLGKTFDFLQKVVEDVLKPFLNLKKAWDLFVDAVKSVPVIGQLISGFVTLCDKASVFANIITALVVVAIGKKIGSMLGLTKIMGEIGTAYTKAGLAGLGFGKAMLKLSLEILPILIARLGKVGVVLAVIMTAMSAYEALKGKQVDWEDKTAKDKYAAGEVENIEALQVQAALIEDTINKKEKLWEENNKLKDQAEKYVDMAPPVIDILTGKAKLTGPTYDPQMAAEEKHNREMLKITKELIETKARGKKEDKIEKGTDDWPEQKKAMIDRTAQKEFSARIQYLKQWERYNLDVLRILREVGLASDEDVYKAKIILAKKVTDEMVKEAEEAKASIDKNIAAVRGDTKMKPERAALKIKELEADKKILDIKIEGLKLQQQQLVNDGQLELFLRRRKQLLADINLIEQKRVINAEIKASVGQERITGEREWTEHDYNKGYAGATKYYDKMYDLVDQETKKEEVLLQEKYDSDRKRLEAERDYKEWIEIGGEWKLAQTSVNRQEEIDRELEVLDATHNKNIVQNALNTSAKKRQIAIKEADDFNKIYEDAEKKRGGSGFDEVTKKSLKDLYGELSKIGDRINKLVVNIAQGMTDAFEEFFFDAMTGKMKSFSDYWESFVNSLKKASSQFLSQQAMKWILGGLGAGGGGLMYGGLASLIPGGASSWGMDLSNWSSFEGMTAAGVHEGGKIGVDKPTFTRIVPAHIFENAPYLHKGLQRDEFPAILQKGETVRTEQQEKALKTAGNVSVTVPINIKGYHNNKKMISEIRSEIEDTVLRVIRRHS